MLPEGTDDMNFQYNYEDDDVDFQYNYEDDDVDFQYNYEDDMDFQYNYEDEENEENEEDNDDVENKEEDNDDTEDENNNGGNEDDKENDNREEEHHQIIDKALDKDNMPSYDSEFASYFQNFTTAALFCWVQKHNILTNAYKDLVDIITNSEFNGNHVVKNIQRF